MSSVPTPKAAQRIIDAFFFDGTAPQWLKNVAKDGEDDEENGKDEKEG